MSVSESKSYVLDANVFIEAHQKYYARDICPGFWRALIRQHQRKRVFSIDRVKKELVDVDDALSTWVKDAKLASFFKKTADEEVIDRFREMVKWVQGESQFRPEAKSEFASVADGWIIAYATVNNLVVVTHEEFAPYAKKRVPMPNVCNKFKVEKCNTFEMLRDLNIKFLLK